MGVRTESAAAIDEALPELQAAIVDWLDEGGDATLILAWLYQRLSATDERLARAYRRKAGNLIDADPRARAA